MNNMPIRKYSFTITLCSFLILWYFIIQLFLGDFLYLIDSSVFRRTENSSLIEIMISMISHKSAPHLVKNVFIIFINGLFIENFIKSKTLLFYTSILFIFISVANLIVLPEILSIIVDSYAILGFSNVMMGILGLSVFLVYKNRGYIIQNSPFSRFYVGIVLLALILIPTIEILSVYSITRGFKNPLSSQVLVDVAHLYGFFCGVITFLLIEFFLKVKEMNFNVIN